MLSGSVETHSQQQNKHGADGLTSPEQQKSFEEEKVKHQTLTSPAAPMSLNEIILQDRAIQEIRSTPFTPKSRQVPADALPELGMNKLKAPKVKLPVVILAEAEAIDKMIYYDKSRCMHAPKACHVPKF